MPRRPGHQAPAPRDQPTGGVQQQQEHQGDYRRHPDPDCDQKWENVVIVQPRHWQTEAFTGPQSSRGAGSVSGDVHADRAGPAGRLALDPVLVSSLGQLEPAAGAGGPPDAAVEIEGEGPGVVEADAGEARDGDELLLTHGGHSFVPAPGCAATCGANNCADGRRAGRPLPRWHNRPAPVSAMATRSPHPLPLHLPEQPQRGRRVG
jgi:hypothetical protein